MNVYDQIIADFNTALEDYKCTRLDVKKDVSWPVLENNEFFMGKEVAFELGDRSKAATCFNCVTSSPSLVKEDGIFLYGPDLSSIKNKCNFNRITLLQVDDENDANKAYMEIKQLEFLRYKIIPEGYMILSSSVENREHVRVSKKALKKGLDFSTVGSLIIKRYKEHKSVKAVQVFFITDEALDAQKLLALGCKARDITDAFDHILKGIVFDCALCPLQPICDDVEGLREVHFSQKQNTGEKNETR